jgi:hypothetical protein
MTLVTYGLISSLVWDVGKKSRKPSVRVADVYVEVRIRHVLNRSYSYTRLEAVAAVRPTDVVSLLRHAPVQARIAFVSQGHTVHGAPHSSNIPEQPFHLIPLFCIRSVAPYYAQPSLCLRKPPFALQT